MGVPLTYLDELFETLARHSVNVPVVVGGSVLSQGDKAEIEAKGVAATFGPGTGRDEIIQRIRALVAEPGPEDWLGGR